MLFNSLTFGAFFTVFYFLYLACDHKRRNLLLLFASYVFYGWWDWRFLSLLALSTAVDYGCGLAIDSNENQSKRKIYLGISICVNLGLLGVFKYFHFFEENLRMLAGSFGWHLNPVTLQIVLPVGISFYTFQTMSYTIDIYRKQMKPTRRFLDFALFVSFFPQLVAGPIERASHLLPQVLQPRTVTTQKFSEGCYLFFGGLFQKVVIADNLSRIVDHVFQSQGPLQGANVLLAIYAFAFQIYCDFAGYSNMARGLGKTMGFDIVINFRSPYLAATPHEFWKRWHISLSEWLRDYLYIPLGGSRLEPLKTVRNLFVTMLLGGLWHGASWTFVLWGGFHAFLLASYRVVAPLKSFFSDHANSWVRECAHVFGVVLFFHFVCLGWLLFRAESMGQVYEMCTALFTNFHLELIVTDIRWFYFLMTLSPLLLIYILRQGNPDDFALFKLPLWLRWTIYICGFHLFIIFGVQHAAQFIYFQF